MPISEDEFELQHSTMSKAELRKTHKPIMEKRRRARINTCLNEIKALILEAMNKDPSRHSKLEKADILEMAVKHLQNVQRQQLALAIASDPSVIRKFKSGFNECAQEIDRYVSRSEGVDTGIKDRMRTHLQKCISGIEQVAHFNFPAFSNLPFAQPAASAVYKPTATGGDANNNAPRLQLPAGVQLIPSRLPTGEIALVVPNSTHLAPFVVAPAARGSAFAAVVPAGASPRGRAFRPVGAAALDEQEVPEVRTIKFPIHNYGEKVAGQSPRRAVEPLCIITNRAERFKQAQVREDGASYEENRVGGAKRKLDMGLLAVVEPKAKSASREEPAPSRDDGGGDMWRPW